MAKKAAKKAAPKKVAAKKQGVALVITDKTKKQTKKKK
jgi:hypothetical protein